MENKIILEGFGPFDLIEQVKKSGWVPCSSSGNNFDGITLGGYTLTDTPDELCSIRFRVTIEAPSTTDRFAIEGYSYPNFITCILNDEEGKTSREPTLFADYQLIQKPKKGMRFYRVTIEVVS